MTDRRAAAPTVAAERVAAAAAAAAAAGTSSAAYAAPNGSPAFLLNYKQQLFVDIVVEHAHSVDACRLAAREVPTGSDVQDWPKPLRIILTGTAGTGKIVINEIVRLLGYLAPTGNVAVAIDGEVRDDYVFACLGVLYNNIS